MFNENKEFENLVKTILNIQFKIGLESNILMDFQGSKFEVDLADREAGYYVEIKNGYTTNNRGTIIRELGNRFVTISRQIKGAKLILVVNENLDDVNINYIKDYFKRIINNEVHVFDRSEIETLAIKYKLVNDKTKKWSNFLYNLNTSYQNIINNAILNSHLNEDDIHIFLLEPFSLKNLTTKEKVNIQAQLKFWQNEFNKLTVAEQQIFLDETNRFIISLQKNNDSNVPIDRSYYLAGAFWSGDQQIERFFKEGIWENGDSESYKDIINNIHAGDIIFLKSAFATKTESILRLKGIGEVKTNPKNGTTLTVDWKIKNIQIDIEGLGKYRRTIAIISPADLTLILMAIGDNEAIGEIFMDSFNLPPVTPINSSGISNNYEGGDNEKMASHEKIPFHLDQVETIDRLNREGAAKSLARLINNEVFSGNNLQHGFMIHLQGEWGDGKSTFLNLIEKNLPIKDRKWIIIKYNAWRNQHINPPWWSFLNDIYRQSKEELPEFKSKLLLLLKENYRRICKYESFKKIVTFLLMIFFVILFLYNYDSLFTIITKNRNVISFNNKNEGIQLEVFAKLITSIGGIVGLLYSLSKFLSSPVFLRSSNSTKSFLERSEDPMKKVKTHYEELVDNIKHEGYELAIFIDDLDRCNDGYVVGLLEGIQTLFKDRKVLFVVAADRHWICQCFENHYSKYNEVAKQPAQKLGYLFIEKAFQLSIRLPKISNKTKEEYWSFILNTRIEQKNNTVTLDEKLKKEVITKIETEKNKDQYFDPKYLEKIQKEYNLNSNDALDAVLQVIDSNAEDIKHRLKNHHTLIATNPRSIKRLANEYTMYRNILVSERKEFNRDKLFRWLILSNKYPQFTDWLESNPHLSISSLNKDLESLQKNKDWEVLFYDKANIYGGPITKEDISLFTGVEIKS